MITATENKGSPIIGRIVRRSMTRPSRAANPRATNTLRIHGSHDGPPRFMRGFCTVVNGMFSSTTRNDRNSAPHIARAPWEKLTVWVALKMSTKPRAMSAYTDPRASAFISVWKNVDGSCTSW